MKTLWQKIPFIVVFVLLASMIISPAATPGTQALGADLFSVLSPDADADQDGLTNDQEVTLRTDPNNVDSDCDYIDDGAEVGNPASPTNSDGDAVINALENNLADSDQDGTKDHLDASSAVQVTCGRFKPFAIFNNGTDSTRLEVRVTGGNNITAVTLQAPTAFTGNELRLDGVGITSLQLIPLYDDGDFTNHGDVSAGDGIWSRKGFTSVYNPYYWSHEFRLQRFIVTDNSGNTNVFWFGSGSPFPGVTHYISVGVVRATENTTIYPLKTGVQATSNLFNIVNPKGSLDPKANRGQASAQLFYNTLPGDDYDFLVFYPDSHMPVSYAAMNHPVQNTVLNIGKSTYNYTASYGSSGRLQSLILTNYQYALPLLHEIMHQWWSPVSSPLTTLGFHQCIDISHWGVSGIGNGQLGGFDPATLVPLGGNVYQVGEFNLNHNGGDSVNYAQLELYLAGFLPSGSVSNMTIPNSVNCSSLNPPGGFYTSFSALSLTTVTMDQVKTALGGERNPSYATSQKNFKAAMVILSQDLLTAAEMAFYNSQAKNLGAVTGSYGMKSFKEATLGVATLDTTVISTSGPEMNVKWTSGPSIASGDMTPSTVDGTDFGSVDVASGNIVRTFTIENMGNANLILNGLPIVSISGAHAADFSVTANPISPIIPGSSTTFNLSFDPSASGLRVATVSISNNDSDENPYIFAIQGTGTISSPGAFGKTSPANGATGVSTSPTLSWGSSSGATSYEYCYDTSNDNNCSGWTSNGAATSKALSGLTPGVTYYWHVRALNAGGTTYADGSATAFWSFTTEAVISNDNFDTPIIISGLPYSNNQDVAGFTTDIDDPAVPCIFEMDKGSLTAWYRFSPTQNGTIKVSTEGSGYDTALAVWTGTRGSLTNVGCNDDANQGLHSELTIIVSSGVTYFIEIVSYHELPSNTSLALSVRTAAPLEPEMDMVGKDGISIDNNDDTPSSVDGTDFGSVAVSGVSADQEFMIVNNGFSELILNGTPSVDITGAHAGDFTVIVQPDSPIPTQFPNFTTFTVRFDPSAPGLRTAVISIVNNDSDENPYTFVIQGTGSDLPYKLYLPSLIR